MKEKLTALTYFPFFGWMFSMGIWPDDKNIRFHARQAFITACIFTFLLIFLSFTGILVPDDARIFRLVLVIITYIVDILYLSLCIAGTILQQKNKQTAFPVVSRYLGRVDI